MALFRVRRIKAKVNPVHRFTLYPDSIVLRCYAGMSELLPFRNDGTLWLKKDIFRICARPGDDRAGAMYNYTNDNCA